jgi:hypothetical protein
MDPALPKKFHECRCDFCDAAFSSRDGLRDHLKSRHPEELTGKRVPTLCAFCQVPDFVISRFRTKTVWGDFF